MMKADASHRRIQPVEISVNRNGKEFSGFRGLPDGRKEVFTGLCMENHGYFVIGSKYDRVIENGRHLHGNVTAGTGTERGTEVVVF
jgi:hypothetical protein